MKKIYNVILATLLFSLNINAVKAQLTGVKNIPGDYPDLAAAVADLNAQGVGAGGVTFNLVSGNSQTAPAGGYVIGGTGSLVLSTASISNPIIFTGNGNTLMAPNPQVAGLVNDAIIKLIGADYVTISGFTIMENPSNTNDDAVLNNMTEWGIALLHASPTDGCQNNTIQNNIISLVRSYNNTAGIYSNNRHSATDVINVEEAGNSTTGVHMNNNVFSNAISNVNYGIVFIGSGVSDRMDMNNNIGGTSSATGNNITNWGGGGAATPYVSLTGSTVGIYANHQSNVNISYNTLVSATVVATSAFTGIFTDYEESIPTGTITNNINNNSLTITNAASTGQIQHVRSSLSIGGSAPGITINILNNNILNSSTTAASNAVGILGLLNNGAFGTVNMNGNIIRSLTSAATTAGFTGIINQAAVVNATNMNNNIIGDVSGSAIQFSAATSASITGISNTATSATNVLTISGNAFSGNFHSVASTGGFQCINSSAAVLSENISNNNFENITINTSFSLVGFLIVATNATPTVTINNNTANQFLNGHPTGSANHFAVACNSGATLTGTSTISGNTFSNFTFRANNNSGALFWANGNIAGSTHNIIVNDNRFSNFTNLSTSATANSYVINIGYGFQNVISNNTVSGISGNGQNIGINASTASLNASGGYTVFGNTVFNISSTTASSQAQGISISVGPAYQDIYKNKIYDIVATNTGSAIGLLSNNPVAGSTQTIYNNIIGRIYAPNSTINVATRGLVVNSTVANTYNIYYNTVYMDGNSPTMSNALYTNSIVPTIDIRNNIFINNSTATGTGEQVAYFRNGVSDLSTYALTSNNNIYYAGTPGPLHLIYSEGAPGALINPMQTLAAFQAHVAPRETNSYTELTPFYNTTDGSLASYLHVNPAGGSLAESGAVNIAGITDDYDGEIRQGNPGYVGTGTAPDIGADEFDFSTIPVVIEYFRGSKQNNGNLLDWKVSIVNSPHATLSLERSADSRSFTSIYSITATSSRAQSPFNYMDANPAAGTNYYRLRMEDADGKLSYSHIVALINRDKGFEILALMPNPARDVTTLNLSSATASRLEIIITDKQGRQMQRQSAKIVAGSNLVPLPVNHLAPGTYHVSVFTDAGERTTIPFIKL